MPDLGQNGETGETGHLLEEMEQLRTALEAALDENARLADERDRLLRRATSQARDLQAANDAFARATESRGTKVEEADTVEELRVAFEELQVLTEEMEVTNASLEEANRTLDRRVEERTRELENANGALRHSEARFRAVANLVPDLLWSGGRDGLARWYNERWNAYTGQKQRGEDERSGNWTDAVHPVERATVRNVWRNAVLNERPFARELRLRAADGSYRWFLARAEQARDENGGPGPWFGTLTDIHDQRTALAALGRSELRFRSLVEGIPQLVWRAVDGGEWTWSSPQWTGFTGLSEARSRGKGWQQALHPDDRAAADAAWERARETGALEMESRIFGVGDNRHRHFRTRAVPARAADGRVMEWLGTSTDVDDMLAMQRQQGVLIAELQHRTRNLMTVVQAILHRTLRDSRSMEEFSAAIKDRLAALARVQGVLSRRDNGQRIQFDMLLREELAAHVILDEHGRGANVEASGPAGVPLFSATVQTLALALHELVTNAVKHGALSARDGRLSVTWDVADMDGKRWLRIEWRESGVPGMPQPGAPPTAGGYGRELIERALPYQLGARTNYAFGPGGVHCSVAVPIAEETV